MRLGRLHLAGAGAWPDHLLEAGQVAVGVVLAIGGRLCVGFELCRSRGGRNVWLNVYLGWWAFEFYLDIERGLGDYDPEWDG